MKSDKEPYELDVLLKSCLHTEETPDARLRQSVMQEWKENSDMRKKRSYKAAAAAIVCIGALSAVTVHAAMRFLTPDKAAEELGYGQVAELFRGIPKIPTKRRFAPIAARKFRFIRFFARAADTT